MIQKAGNPIQNSYKESMIMYKLVDCNVYCFNSKHVRILQNWIPENIAILKFLICSVNTFFAVN